MEQPTKIVERGVAANLKTVERIRESGKEGEAENLRIRLERMNAKLGPRCRFLRVQWVWRAGVGTDLRFHLVEDYLYDRQDKCTASSLLGADFMTQRELNKFLSGIEFGLEA